MSWRRTHLALGALGLAYFLGTGLYLQLGRPGIYHGDEAVRMLFRSRHLYILLASLVQAGASLARMPLPSRKLMDGAASLALALGFAGHAAAFWVEPGMGPGPGHAQITLYAAILGLAGTALKLLVLSAPGESL